MEQSDFPWPSFCVVADNPKESSRVPVYIKVLDVNDNAPEFPMFYETFVCENAKSEQVCSLPSVNKYVCVNTIHIGIAVKRWCSATQRASGIGKSTETMATLCDYSWHSIISWSDTAFVNGSAWLLLAHWFPIPYSLLL